MAVTIKDIAREAGVSHTTVSRSLHGHPAIPEDTANRIKKIADELGYVPSAVARGLKNNRSGVLGVVMQRIIDPFYAEVLDGIEDELETHGYCILIASCQRDCIREKSIVRTMSERRVDGIIITSTAVSETQRLKLNQFGVPVVVIHNQVAKDTPNSVFHNDIEGGFQLTNHLIDLGHTKIGYVGNTEAERSSSDRLKGLQNALRAANLPLREEWVVADHKGLPQNGARAAGKLLRCPEKPTAVVCFNDLMAMGAMQQFIQAGYSVPRDVSFTGFDDIEMAAYVNPPLTTFRQPRYQLGQLAARMIVSIVENEDQTVDCDPVKLTGSLIIRQSTVPPQK